MQMYVSELNDDLLIFFRIHLESKCGTEKKFSCDFCLSKFVSQVTLRTHLQIHVGEKKFRCSYCPKNFIFAGQLKVHERQVSLWEYSNAKIFDN